MNEELYVTGVVIPNGLADHEGDVLNKSDIKKIFTKYINRDTDTMHTRIRNNGVDVLANWISEADQVIAGKTAPAGSWLATFHITNSEIIKSIKDGDITGLSLGSVSDTALTQKFWFINKSINYQDLDDMEEVIPLFISFVDKPSNMFGLEIMDYNVYINKNAKVDTMTETEKKLNIEDEKVSIGTLEKLKELLSINKSEVEPVETKEVEINKEVTAVEEPVDISNAELLEKIPEAVTMGITTAFEKMAETKKETVETDEVSVDKNETAPTEEVEEETTTEEIEEEVVEEKPAEEEVEINKRATVKSEAVETVNTGNFYEKAGRDMWGCKK